MDIYSPHLRLAEQDPNLQAEPELSVVRQFEKLEPAMEYFDRSREIYERLFKPYLSEESSVYKDKAGKVRVFLKDGLQSYTERGVGVGVFLEDSRIFHGHKMLGLLLMKETVPDAIRPRYRALHQCLHFHNYDRLSYSYGLLEMHPSGLMDYVSRRREVNRNHTADEVYRGEYGPHGAATARRNYEPPGYAVNVGSVRELSMLSSNLANFASSVHTDTELLDWVRANRDKQTTALRALKLWMSDAGR